MNASRVAAWPPVAGTVLSPACPRPRHRPSTILALAASLWLLLASTVSIAAPLQSFDPANVDAGAGRDAPAIPARAAVPAGSPQAQPRPTWDDLTQIPAERYRQAYGSDAARARFGRSLPRQESTAGTSNAPALDGIDSVEANAQRLLREMEPAARKLKRDIDSGLTRGRRR